MVTESKKQDVGEKGEKKGRFKFGKLRLNKELTTHYYPTTGNDIDVAHAR